MSWSIDKIYKDVSVARGAMADEKYIPKPIVEYITAGLLGLGNTDKPVLVKGNGHVCEGPASYNVTTCSLEVRPLEITS